MRAKKYIFQFFDVHREQFVVFDNLSAKGVTSVGTMHGPVPKGEILGVIAKKDKQIRIKKAAFTEWVYEHLEEPPTRLVQALAANGCKVRKASITKGVPHTVQSRVAVIDIPLDDAVFGELLESTELD